MTTSDRRGTAPSTGRRAGAKIDLLVDLLRHHSDLTHDDLISDALYAKLLAAAGRELFELLFVGGLNADVAQALGRFTEEEIDLLRVKLSFEGHSQPWLAGLPWEYLHTPLGDAHFDEPGVFLWDQAELMLSRRLEARNVRPIGDATPLNVLLVCPRPPHRGDEDPEVEQVDPTKVIEKFQTLAAKGKIRLHTLIDDPSEEPVERPERVTRSALLRRVKDKTQAPVILHFLGHGRNFGGEGQLLLSRADGTQDWIDARHFADSVKRRSVKLVFLQACESALPDQYIPFSSVAERLALSGRPAVVAMQYRIKTELATAFTEGFYDELLLNNSPIDVAVEAGRVRIDGEMDDRDRLAFGLPVVYLASHEGMLLDEQSAPGEEPVDRKDQPRASDPCPNCGTIRTEPTPRAAIGVACRSAVAKAMPPDPFTTSTAMNASRGSTVSRRSWSRRPFPAARRRREPTAS